MHLPLFKMIARARPDVVQVAPIIRAIRQRGGRGDTIAPLWGGRAGERFALELEGLGARPMDR